MALTGGVLPLARTEREGKRRRSAASDSSGPLLTLTGPNPVLLLEAHIGSRTAFLPRPIYVSTRRGQSLLKI